ncbi:hypothetical protein ACLQ28_20020, partial [Micromonospora sp. DT201]
MPETGGRGLPTSRPGTPVDRTAVPGERAAVPGERASGPEPSPDGGRPGGTVAARSGDRAGPVAAAGTHAGAPVDGPSTAPARPGSGGGEPGGRPMVEASSRSASEPAPPAHAAGGTDAPVRPTTTGRPGGPRAGERSPDGAAQDGVAQDGEPPARSVDGSEEAVTTLDDLLARLRARGLDPAGQFDAVAGEWSREARRSGQPHHVPDRELASARAEHGAGVERDLAGLFEGPRGARTEASPSAPHGTPSPERPVAVSAAAEVVRGHATALRDRLSMEATRHRSLDQLSRDATALGRRHRADHPDALSADGYRRVAGDLRTELGEAVRQRYGPTGEHFRARTGDGGVDSELTAARGRLLDEYPTRVEREARIEREFRAIERELDEYATARGGSAVSRERLFDGFRRQVVHAERAGLGDHLPTIRENIRHDLDLFLGLERWADAQVAAFRRQEGPLSPEGYDRARADLLDRLSDGGDLEPGSPDSARTRARLGDLRDDFVARIRAESLAETEFAKVRDQGVWRPWESAAAEEAAAEFRAAIRAAGPDAPAELLREIRERWSAGLRARLDRAAAISGLADRFDGIAAGWKAERAARGEPYDVPDSVLGRIRGEYDAAADADLTAWRAGNRVDGGTEIEEALAAHADTARTRLGAGADLADAAAGIERRHLADTAPGRQPLSPAGFARARADHLDEIDLARARGGPETDRVPEIGEGYRARLDREHLVETEYAAFEAERAAVAARNGAEADSARVRGEAFDEFRTRVLAAGPDPSPHVLRGIRRDVLTKLGNGLWGPSSVGTTLHAQLRNLFDQGMTEFRTRTTPDGPQPSDRDLLGIEAEFRQRGMAAYEAAWERLGPYRRAADVRAEWLRGMTPEVVRVADALGTRVGLPDAGAVRAGLVHDVGRWADTSYARLQRTEPGPMPSAEGFARVRADLLRDVRAAVAGESRLGASLPPGPRERLGRLTDDFAGRLRLEQRYEGELAAGRAGLDEALAGRRDVDSFASTVRAEARRDLRAAIHAAGPDAPPELLGEIGRNWRTGLRARVDEAARLVSFADRFDGIAAEARAAHGPAGRPGGPSTSPGGSSARTGASSARPEGAQAPASIRADFEARVAGELRTWRDGADLDDPVSASTVADRLDAHARTIRDRLDDAARREFHTGGAGDWARRENARLTAAPADPARPRPSAAGLGRARGDHADAVGAAYDETIGRAAGGRGVPAEARPAGAPRESSAEAQRVFDARRKQLEGDYPDRVRQETLVESEYATIEPELAARLDGLTGDAAAPGRIARIRGEAFADFRDRFLRAPDRSPETLAALRRAWADGLDEGILGGQPTGRIAGDVTRLFDGAVGRLRATDHLPVERLAAAADRYRARAGELYEQAWRESGEHARLDDVRDATAARLRPETLRLDDELALAQTAERMFAAEQRAQLAHFGDARRTGDLALTPAELRSIRDRLDERLTAEHRAVWGDRPGEFSRPAELADPGRLRSWQERLDRAAGDLPDWAYALREARLAGTAPRPGEATAPDRATAPDGTAASAGADRAVTRAERELERRWARTRLELTGIAWRRARLEQELVLRGNDPDAVFDRTVRAWREAHPEEAGRVSTADLEAIRTGEYDPDIAVIREHAWGDSGRPPLDSAGLADLVGARAAVLPERFNQLARDRIAGPPAGGDHAPEAREPAPDSWAGGEESWRELQRIRDPQTRADAAGMFEQTLARYDGSRGPEGRVLSQGDVDRVGADFFRAARDSHEDASRGPGPNVTVRDAWLSRMVSARERLADDLALAQVGSDMFAKVAEEPGTRAAAAALTDTEAARVRAVLDTTLRQARARGWSGEAGAFARRHESGSARELRDWRRELNEFAEPLRQRIAQERRFGELVVEAAREFDTVMGGGSSRALRIADSTRDALGERLRREFVGGYQGLRGMNEAESGRWLGHEAAHESRFATLLHELAGSRPGRRWEAPFTQDSLDAVVPTGTAPLGRDDAHLLPEGFGGVHPTPDTPPLARTADGDGGLVGRAQPAAPERSEDSVSPELDLDEAAVRFAPRADELVDSYRARLRDSAGVEARRPDFAADFAREVGRTGELGRLRSDDGSARFGSLDGLSTAELVRWRGRFVAEGRRLFEDTWTPVRRENAPVDSEAWQRAAAEWEQGYAVLRAQLRLDGFHRHEIGRHEPAVTDAARRARERGVSEQDIAEGVRAFARDVQMTADDLVGARPPRGGEAPGRGDAFDPAHRARWDAADEALRGRLDQYLRLSHESRASVERAVDRAAARVRAWADTDAVPVRELRQQVEDLPPAIGAEVRQRAAEAWLRQRWSLDYRDVDHGPIARELDGAAQQIADTHLERFERMYGGPGARERLAYEGAVDTLANELVADLVATVRTSAVDLAPTGVERMARELRYRLREVDTAQRSELAVDGYAPPSVGRAIDRLIREAEAARAEMPARVRYEERLVVAVEQAGHRWAELRRDVGGAPPADDFVRDFLRGYDETIGGEHAGLRDRVPEHVIDELVGEARPIVDEALRAHAPWTPEQVADAILRRTPLRGAEAERAGSAVYVHIGAGPRDRAYSSALSTPADPDTVRVVVGGRVDGDVLDWYLGELPSAARTRILLDLAHVDGEPAPGARLADALDVTVEVPAGRAGDVDAGRLAGYGPNGGRVPVPFASTVRVAPAARAHESLPQEHLGLEPGPSGRFRLGDEWTVEVRRDPAGEPGTFVIDRSADGPHGFVDGPPAELAGRLDDLTRRLVDAGLREVPYRPAGRTLGEVDAAQPLPEHTVVVRPLERDAAAPEPREAGSTTPRDLPPVGEREWPANWYWRAVEDRFGTKWYLLKDLDSRFLDVGDGRRTVPVEEPTGPGPREFPAQIRDVDGDGWVWLPRGAVAGRHAGGDPANLPDRWMRLPEPKARPVGEGPADGPQGDAYYWERYKVKFNVRASGPDGRPLGLTNDDGYRLGVPEPKPASADGGAPRRTGGTPGGDSPGDGRPLGRTPDGRVDRPAGGKGGLANAASDFVPFASRSRPEAPEGSRLAGGRAPAAADRPDGSLAAGGHDPAAGTDGIAARGTVGGSPWSGPGRRLDGSPGESDAPADAPAPRAGTTRPRPPAGAPEPPAQPPEPSSGGSRRTSGPAGGGGVAPRRPEVSGSRTTTERPDRYWEPTLDNPGWVGTARSRPATSSDQPPTQTPQERPAGRRVVDRTPTDSAEVESMRERQNAALDARGLGRDPAAARVPGDHGTDQPPRPPVSESERTAVPAGGHSAVPRGTALPAGERSEEPAGETVWATAGIGDRGAGAVPPARDVLGERRAAALESAIAASTSTWTGPPTAQTPTGEPSGPTVPSGHAPDPETLRARDWLAAVTAPIDVQAAGSRGAGRPSVPGPAPDDWTELVDRARTRLEVLREQDAQVRPQGVASHDDEKARQARRLKYARLRALTEPLTPHEREILNGHGPGHGVPPQRRANALWDLRSRQWAIEHELNTLLANPVAGSDPLDVVRRENRVWELRRQLARVHVGLSPDGRELLPRLNPKPKSKPQPATDKAAVDGSGGAGGGRSGVGRSDDAYRLSREELAAR